jgi:hypothetical protein
MFVHVHKNGNEPVSSLQLWQNAGSSLLLAVWQLQSDFVACYYSCKLLVVSFVTVVLPLQWDTYLLSLKAYIVDHKID